MSVRLLPNSITLIGRLEVDETMRCFGNKKFGNAFFPGPTV